MEKINKILIFMLMILLIIIVGLIVYIRHIDKILLDFNISQAEFNFDTNVRFEDLEDRIKVLENK